jgi:hypothetical protein
MALTQIEQGMLKDGILTADTAGRLKMADGFVNTAKLLDANVTAAKLASGAARSNFGAGAVLQVVQTKKTNTFSSASTSFIDITGMSAAITPSSASNLILVSFVLNISSNSAGWYGSQVQLVRNSTNIASGDASGSMSPCTLDYSFNTGNSSLITPMPMQWVDSPATTSSVTYKLQMRSIQGTTNWVNRSTYDNGSDNYDSLVVSTITLMEIAA